MFLSNLFIAYISNHQQDYKKQIFLIFRWPVLQVILEDMMLANEAK